MEFPYLKHASAQEAAEATEGKFLLAARTRGCISKASGIVGLS
jgi:hypothetical protein